MLALAGLCVQSHSGFPSSNYGNNQLCTITAPAGANVSATYFATHSGDTLTINDHDYYGLGRSAFPLMVQPIGDIIWSTNTGARTKGSLTVI